MKKLLYFISLLLSGFCIAQKDSYVETISEQDSLEIINYRTKLAQYVNPIPDSAFFYGRKIRTTAANLNYGKGIADADYLLGACFKRVQQNDSAIIYFKKSLKLSKELDYDIGKGRAYNNLGRTYYLLGEMDNSITASKNAIASIENSGPTEDMIIADSHTALATAYSRKNDMNNAIIQLLKVDSMHQKAALRPDVIAAAYQSLGNIYLELEEYPTAIDQFQKANNEFSKLPHSASQFYKNTTNVFLGNTYLQTEKLIAADSLLSTAYKYFKQAEDQRLVAEIANYLGQLELKKNNIVKAEIFFTESFTIHKDNNRPFEAAQGALEIIKLELSKNNPEKARYYLEQAETLNIDAQNSKLTQELLFYKAQILSLQGNFKEAYAYSNKAKRLQDSLQRIQSSEKIKEIESIYETESKDREIQLLTSQKKLAEQQKTNQRNLLLGGLCITSILGLFFFFQYKNRQKIHKKLQELDIAKSTFFANISHEFRTPLTLIKGPIEDQLENGTLTFSERKNLTSAKQNTQRLERLVKQLLGLSKLESGTFKLKVQPGNLPEFLKAQAAFFNYKSQENVIDFVSSISPLNEMAWFDRDVLEKACVNLLGNAFKYTPLNGRIKFNGTLEDGTYKISVQNSGTYLNDDETSKIFERFYQTDPNNPGTGIGLALTKELITLHKGTIKVTSNRETGTEFIIYLPYQKSAFNIDEIVDSPHIKFTSEIAKNIDETLLSKSTSKEDAPILHIIEDTTDIRNYVNSIFNETFIVNESANGNDGIESATTNIPDIIICDIMMPGIDGFEVTKQLKNNPLTAHIPIILLTAKVEDVDKIKGNNIGADAYVSKPFNSQLLKAQVRNLLENRRKLQERFSQEVILRPKEIAITSAEEQFLDQLQSTMDKHLTDAEFNATRFHEVMAMSRMQLHRKLKALTGQSTTEFLRSQRLKAATLLLKQDKISISEVGYSVGFNDPSYFAKCFKQEYGMSPTKYAEINSRKTQ